MVFLTAVFDALDGIVARMRDLSSKRGDLVDHTLDRVADIIIVGGIAMFSVLLNELFEVRWCFFFYFMFSVIHKIVHFNS